MYSIVVLGDSIAWGQGLLEAEKFASLLKNAIAASPLGAGGVQLESLAHSGAVIDDPGGTGHPVPYGEVPDSVPTIMDQAAQFQTPGDQVDLVLVQGGINDVGIKTILNPLALYPSLAGLAQAACHDRMYYLLRRIQGRCTSPTARVLVTGYYKILSALSDPLGVERLLQHHGMHLPPFVDRAIVCGAIVDRCAEFYAASERALAEAVYDIHDPRFTFVTNGFTDANSAFAPDPLLFGLNLGPGGELAPEDPMAGDRRPMCDQSLPGILKLLDREACYRASAGHPNPAGAARYFTQLRAVLGV